MVTTCCGAASSDRNCDFPVKRRTEVEETPKKEPKGCDPEEDSPCMEREDGESIRSRTKTVELNRDASSSKLI